MTCCSITSASWTICASPLPSLVPNTPRSLHAWCSNPRNAKTLTWSGCWRHLLFSRLPFLFTRTNEFPEITEGLLTVVYPQLVRPLPSMSVVEFQLDPEKGKLTSGLKIERHSQLLSKPVGGVPCTFRTCYDTTLWPLTVTAAEWRAPSRLQPAVKTNDSAWAIRLELRCARDVTLPNLRLDQLRFYLDGE